MHWNVVKNGALRLEVRFDTALEQTINCVCMLEYDNIIEIDANRQVTVDYSN